MKPSKQFFLENEEATLDIAKRFACALKSKTIVYLQGELGAGKTCFCRGVIQSLGFDGRVKSPTFTLVEPYKLALDKEVFHFDFYRLSDPEEVFYLGVDNYIENGFLCLMEWPDKASGYIPEADVVVKLSYIDESRKIELIAATEIGCLILQAL